MVVVVVVVIIIIIIFVNLVMLFSYWIKINLEFCNICEDIYEIVLSIKLILKIRFWKGENNTCTPKIWKNNHKYPQVFKKGW